MASFNRVILMGNLTRDPELRYTPGGVAVTDLSLAVNEVRGRGDDRKETAHFFDVTVWDRMAENCSQYLTKGSPVLVEGRLVQDTWEDRETGKKRSKIKVVANTVQFLGGGNSGGGSRGGGGGGGANANANAPAANTPRAASTPSAPAAQNNAPLEDDFGGGDDIPF